MNISVIIPTDGSHECLGLVLASLYDGHIKENDEVVIVDDASAYRIDEHIAAFTSQHHNLRVIRHSWSKGPAAAKNTGIHAAQNELLVFTDDDMIPSKGFIEGHRMAHDKYPRPEYCILGRTSIHPGVEDTRLMSYLVKAGWRQYGCSTLSTEEQEAGPSYFHTSNLSVKKPFLARHGSFDEVFPGSDQESGELGCRLAKHGMKLIYVPDINTAQNRLLTLRGSCTSEYLNGRAFYYFMLKHPDAARRPHMDTRLEAHSRESTADLSDAIEQLASKECIPDIDLDATYETILSRHFISGLQCSVKENEGPQRLHWSGDKWEAMRLSTNDSLVRIQSAYPSERESELILAGLTAEVPVLFIGAGKGSHIEKYMSSQRPEHTALLFEPHDFIYQQFRATHDPRRVIRLTSLDELSAYWPERPLQPCIIPILRDSPGVYAAVHNLFRIHDKALRKVPAKAITRTVVIGPMYGGSYDIAIYAKEAFEALAMDTLFIDNSPHYEQFATLSRDESEAGSRRVNAFINDVVKKNQDVILHAKPDLVFALAQAPVSIPSIHVMKRAGMITSFWFVEDHRVLPYWEDVFRHYDWFFTIQDGAFVTQLRDRGGNAHFLPMAAPAHISTTGMRQAGVVSFVGAPYRNRISVFEALSDNHVYVDIYGGGWNQVADPRIKRLVKKSGRIQMKELHDIYSASGININVHSSLTADGLADEKDFINPRTFEIPACGGFELVDNRDDLEKYYEPGKEIGVFRSVDELAEKIDYYRTHSAEAETIAGNGLRRTRSEHTYTHRMSRALELINRG